MPPTHLIPLRARNTAVSDASPTNALHHSSACPHHLPSRDSIFPIVSPNFGETRRGCLLPSAREKEFESLFAVLRPFCPLSFFLSCGSDSQRRKYVWWLKR